MPSGICYFVGCCNTITIRNTHRNWWRKEIQVLDWPAQSPDLNPIENLFSILKRNVGSKRFSNRDDLFSYLEDEWIRIDPKIIDNLIKSMPRRCAAVIKNKGYYTKYLKFLKFRPLNFCEIITIFFL